MHRPITRRLALLAAATACSAAALVASAPAAVVPQDSADTIAQAIIDDPAVLDLATTDWYERPLDDVTGLPGVTGAVVDAPLDGFPTAGDTFGLLTTGDPALADDANDSQSSGKAVAAANSGPARGDTDYDVTVLKLGVNVPAGANCVSLDYRFLSDEFPEFVGTSFNDAFIGELDTTQWTTAGSTISKPGDFATNTGGAPVSVNGVGPVAVTEAEANGTTYDAATGRINTKTTISPGAHAVFLSIFDQGDAIYDSAVFLDRLSFITEGPSTCRPPEVPAPAPPPAPPAPPGTPPPPSNVFTVGSSITFGANGTATVTVVVPGPGVLTASDGSAGTASVRASAAAKKKAKKKALIATTKVIAKKAGKVKITIKPTAAGKKVLRRKGKLRVKVRLTFTPTGGAPRSQVKSVTLKVKKKKHRH